MGPDIRLEPVRARPLPWRALALLFAAYTAAAGGTALLTEHWLGPAPGTSEAAVPWLAVGIGVTGILVGGARLWPALFAGSWLVFGGLLGHPPLIVTIDAAAEAASIVLTVRLLERFGFQRSFDRFRDPLVLLAAAAVGRLLAVVLDDAGVLIAAGWSPQSMPASDLALVTDAQGLAPRLTPQLLGASLRWGLNSVAGIVLVVPFAVASPAELTEALRRRPLAFAAWGVALALWCALALAAPVEAARLPLLIGALGLVVWAAIRFGVSAATFATLVLSMAAAAGFGAARDPGAGSDTAAGLEALWGFIALLAVTGLLLTVLLAERRRELERLTARAQRYQQLFRKNPSALWVADPAGGRILMVNDQAVRHYGYSEAEFLAMTVDELVAGPPGADDAPTGGGYATRAQRHRTKHGRFIDVELQSTPIELDGRPAVLCYALDVSDRYALRTQLLAAGDVERRRLAQELHDGLGQVLTGLNLGAQGAALRAARGDAIEAGTIDFLVRSSQQAIDLCHKLTRGVSPLEDSDGDLLEAFRRLPDSLPPASRERLEVRVQAAAPLGLSRERAEHLYRVVQEAVGNAIKHSGATHIRVGVGVTTETVAIAVEDDGVGLGASPAAAGGLGMRSMAMRAGAVGGTLEVAARPGGGTVVQVSCPQVEPAATRGPAAAGPPEASAPPLAGGATGTARAWRPGVRTLGECLLLAAACLASLAVSMGLASIVDPSVAMYGGRLAVPSLLTGVSVATFLVRGRRLWPGTALGALVGAGALIHLPWLYAIYYGADSALTSLIACWLLTRFGFTRAFDRWQDPLVLVGAAVASSSASTVFGVVGALSYQWLRPGEFGPGMLALLTDATGATPVLTRAMLGAEARWWADGVAGVVLVVPALAATPPLLEALRERRAEAIVWCLALAGWIASLFALDDAGGRWPLLTVALALLLWAVVRLGVAWASAATFVFAMTATVGFALQRGVFASIGADEGISALWSFLSLLTITGMFLTALLAERNRIRAALATTAERYRRLFESDPHPLWVEDVASGRILIVSPQAVRHYGYAEPEWLALTADRLVAEPAGAGRPAAAADGTIATHHRLRSGAVIEVELCYAPIDADGRPALLCFAVDVTERNALRRGFLEATDIERRRLAAQLNEGLGRALLELRAAAARFQAAAVAGRPDAAAVARVAEASHRAAIACRETAHGASPLQANNGDLVEALLALPEQLPPAATARIDVQVTGAAAVQLPLDQCEHLYGLVRGAVTDAAKAGAHAIVVRVGLEPSLLRVSIEDDGRRERDPPTARVPALHLMALRATSMGARFRHSERAGGGRSIVCECPQPAAAGGARAAQVALGGAPGR